MPRFFRGLPVVAMVAALLTAAVAWADEEKITLDKLPKAVLNAIKAKYPDAKPVGAEKETKGDKIFYEVVIKNKDKSIELLLTPEGKIVEVEQEIAAKDLPKIVAAAIEKAYPKGAIKSVEEVTKEDKVTYGVLLENDVLVNKEKQKVQVHLNADGKITATQKLIAAGDLPTAVTGALEKKYPKASVTRANHITEGDKTSFVVTLETSDKKIGARLDGEGKILKEVTQEKKK